MSGETGGREGEEGREVEGVKEMDTADCRGGCEDVGAGFLVGRGGEVLTVRAGVILGSLLVGAFAGGAGGLRPLRRGRDLEGIVQAGRLAGCCKVDRRRAFKVSE